MLRIAFILCCVFLFLSFVLVQNLLWKMSWKIKKSRGKKWEEPRSPAPPPPYFGPKRGPAQQQQARLASPSPL
jgi:hypothetical protein